VLYFAALLSPILVILVAHHLLEIILERFFSKYAIAINEYHLGATSKFNELVGRILWLDDDRFSLVVSSLIEIIFSSASNFYDLLGWWDELRNLFTLPTLYPMITAAYLYQFEHLVRHH
jgi:hypothetical protein